jgi:MFS family permease
MHLIRRNVAYLAACQALLLVNNVTLIALAGLAGLALAADKVLATLPATTYVIGAALATMPLSLLMKRIGRRPGFMIGAAFGIAGSAICAMAMHLGSFWMLCAGTLVAGAYNASGQLYRFAAADIASEDFKSRAISFVMAGGIVGGVVGPEMAKFTRNLVSAEFAASYGSLVVFGALSLLVLTRVHIPKLAEADRVAAGRPLLEIVRQPVFMVAALGAMIGYGVMNLLMTATPIAMGICSHPFDDAAFVLEWHVIGMFAPSFFTGSLIRRFGVLNIMLVGAGLMVGCVAIAVSGVAVMHFWMALTLLGIGWNFLYIGGTTLLTEAAAPAERAKTQGANDFLVFCTMAISSASSGAMVTQAGWQAMNLWALPFLAVTVAATLLLAWNRKRRAARAAADA